jgi:hypothetical protein
MHEQLEREFEQRTDAAEKKGSAIDTWIESEWDNYNDDLAPEFLAQLYSSNDGAEYIGWLIKRDLESISEVMCMYHDWKNDRMKEIAKEVLGYD